MDICGIYYNIAQSAVRQYLPQVELRSHTTISPVCYTTKLDQKFVNIYRESIEQLRYTFPLYDGVAVSAYSIEYDGKLLKGVVKQNDDAKKTYQEAVDRGETAGLLESLPAGTFGITIGNVRPNVTIHVSIQYIGELKHDAEIDGLRYTLPTSIAPRYGSYPGQVGRPNVDDNKGISISVDVDMAGSAIRKIQSPSHPISMSMGALLSSSSKDSFDASQGSVSLTQDKTEMGRDFIVQILIDDMSKPQAVIEKHPTLDSWAIMMTMVPKFNLPLSSPEIVFVADQSGSMSGSKNAKLVAALQVFLKSLPFGVRFNVCAFGSHETFLFEASRAYNEQNVNEAMRFVSGLDASHGGTEMLSPIKEVFKRRLRDMPLEIMLLTDGEIWQEDELFAYINKEIHEDKVDARVFTLGIGGDVSHALVEGVARAGNGFSQFITNEQMDAKLLRMLRACLYPHVKDYSLEVNFSNESASHDDDFEIVEKIEDCLTLDGDSLESENEAATTSTASTTFFDANADETAIRSRTDETSRYSHLPAITVPKIFQAPSKVPPLYTNSRTTLYIILDAKAVDKKVASVTLRGLAPTGPIEMTIPLHGSAVKSPAIHQLAARKAVQELEEGRGWLQNARLPNNELVKEKFKSRFDEMVEREAVRLGMTYQVAGKWCSFVAVEEHNDHMDVDETDLRSTRPSSESMYVPENPRGSGKGGPFRHRRIAPSSVGRCAARQAPRTQLASMAARRSGAMSFSSKAGSATKPVPDSNFDGLDEDDEDEDDDDMAFGFSDDCVDARFEAFSCTAGPDDTNLLRKGICAASPDEVVRGIISLQAFDGSWTTSEELLRLLNIDATRIGELSGGAKNMTTTVISFLEENMQAQSDVWSFVVEKAKQWLAAQK